MLVAIAVIATGAQGAALLVGNGADETVTASVNASYDEYSAVGAAGGFAVTGTLNVDAGVVLTFTGFEYIPGEDEMHSIDIGGQANAELNLAAGATITADYDIGVGQDGRWFGNDDPNGAFGTYANSGYNTLVNMAPGSAINDTAWSLMFGLGEATNGASVVMNMDSASIVKGPFMLGGTINITGTCEFSGNRFRAYEARVLGLGRDDAAAADALPLLTFNGVNPLYNGNGGWQLGILATDPNTGDILDLNDPNAGHQFGPEVDISGATLPQDQWVTIMQGTVGGWWPERNRDVSLVAGSEGLIQCYSSKGIGRVVQVWVPEPASMALLAIGGIGVLIRRKR